MRGSQTHTVNTHFTSLEKENCNAAEWPASKKNKIVILKEKNKSNQHIFESFRLHDLVLGNAG